MDDQSSELEGASIRIDEGWISSIGREEPASTTDERIDCRRLVAVPGFINAHHHLYQALTRGFPLGSGLALFDWLQMLYPIWAHLDEDMVFASARAGLAELALSGCTTSTDHLYVFPSGSEGFMDAEIEAARGLGVRFQPARGSMDLSQDEGGLPPPSVVQRLDQILEDSERVIDKYHDARPGAMVRIALAPCSPFSSTPNLMRETADLARGKGVRLHTHIAETRDEEAYSVQHYGFRPIDLLEDLGWMGDDVWLAHCVHLAGEDMRLMSTRRVGVAHCPTSNMLLGSGIAPVHDLLAAGATVGLGVDGSASNDSNDLRAEIKQALLSARVRDGAQSLSAREALRLATRGGAACLGRDDIGSIEAGKAADIALFDADALSMAGGQEDLIASIVLCGTNPSQVFVHGQEVVKNGQLAGPNETELARGLNESSARLMQKPLRRA